jgi:hypothetical protein
MTREEMKMHSKWDRRDGATQLLEAIVTHPSISVDAARKVLAVYCELYPDNAINEGEAA